MSDEQKKTELRKYYFRPAPFWERLPASVWSALQSTRQRLTYPKKSIIYAEGSHPRGLYIIRKGRAKVYIINSHGVEQIIYFLGKDEVFGYRTIVCEEPSPVFVEAIDDCTLDCIPRTYFAQFLRESPDLNAVFLNDLGYEFSIFVNKISVFAQKPVSERVALALLALKEKFHEEAALVFTRDDLARYVGTATETLIRQLKILKDEGVIATRGRKIWVENADRLLEMARLA